MSKLNKRDQVNPDDQRAADDAIGATARNRAAASSPVRTNTWNPDTKTYEGGAAHSRDAKSDLFLMAVGSFWGEDTFYESADERTQRFTQLVRSVATNDPIWLFKFLRWLRTGGNMRSAPIVAAVEAVRVWSELQKGAFDPVPHADGGLPVNPDGRVGGTPRGQFPAHEVPGLNDDRGLARALIDVVCQRADEPGALLNYWISNYGRSIPKPIKRGLGDAANRLYNEFSLYKWDSTESAVRFGDVLELCHVKPRMQLQQGSPHDRLVPSPQVSALFRLAIDRRHGRAFETSPVNSEMLPLASARAHLLEVPPAQRRAFLDHPNASQILHEAGMTWESLAGWLQGPLDAGVWERVIPTMGVFALVRNLRNFDHAGISGEVAQRVARKISDPELVTRSQMFPFRYYQAYLAAHSLRWAQALEQALQTSCQNVPELPGRTLVLIDTSASMDNPLSEKSKMTFVEAAALFGMVLAHRNQRRVDLHGFAGGSMFRFSGSDRYRATFRHEFPAGGSVLKEMERFRGRIGEVGHGTEVARSIRETYVPGGHDRVIVITDGQTFREDLSFMSARLGSVSNSVPASVPIYGVNLVGYAPSMLPAGTSNRHEIGGSPTPHSPRLFRSNAV